mmetsp:Transcript_68454/g.182608  ORF Transcript_68454/g.182608 Transcript_68454/m.182608 type:complete len:132 (-) Transcript_68454:301-696(-)
MSSRSHRTKTKLTVAQVREIYAFKVRPGTQPSSVKIGEMYGISDKAVRDIWIGRTWLSETVILDDPAEAARRLSQPRVARKASTIIDRTHHSSGSSCEGSRELPNMPYFLDDPFHDDWPHWTTEPIADANT